MKNNRFHVFLLLICAVLWGTTFVAQSIGAGYVGAFTYLMGRSWIAVVILTPVIHALDKVSDRRGVDNRRPRNKEEQKLLIFSGIICGTFLCFASAAQQAGMAYTSASKAGFLTAIYVILVPIFSIFLHKKPPVQIWICAAISLCGLFLLCMGKSLITGETMTIQKGDAFMVLCAALFSVQVLCLDKYSPMVDGVRLSRMQFIVVSVESTIIMFLFEHPTMETLRMALPAILYAGVFSSGVAYTLQIIGQEGVNPTVAVLVMSMESVFSAISGWIVLGERMLPLEMLGAVFMFVSIVLAQIPIGQKNRQ